MQRPAPQVGPECVLGLEISPFAAELARVSTWIAEIQWMRRNGFEASTDPILKPLDTIQCVDALLDWGGDGGVNPALHDAAVGRGSPRRDETSTPDDPRPGLEPARPGPEPGGPLSAPDAPPSKDSATSATDDPRPGLEPGPLSAPDANASGDNATSDTGDPRPGPDPGGPPPAKDAPPSEHTASADGDPGSSPGRDTPITTDPTRRRWPTADFIVGNPPFLGNKKMVAELGENYTTLT